MADETRNPLERSTGNQHPDHDHRPVCALPRKLWSILREKLGADRFDAQLLKADEQLSSECGDMTRKIGRWGDIDIRFGLLRLSTVAISDDEAKLLERTNAQASHLQRIFNERIGRFWMQSRSYLGWLLSNRQFINEHDGLVNEWGSEIRKWRFPNRGVLAVPDTQIRDAIHEIRIQQFDAAFEKFFIRWRLQGLVAPYVPVPLSPLFAGGVPASMLHLLENTGAVFYIPDTFPVPSRDQLLGMLDDALHAGQAPEHLDEWMQIVRRDNSAKAELQTWSRLFEVQHYWRILKQRHSSALTGNAGKTQEAIAEFLGEGNEQPIKRALQRMRDNLGTEWC